MTRRVPEEYVWGALLFDETWLDKHYTPQSSKNLKAIVVHHMAMRGAGNGKALDAVYRTWQTRPASAHYGVDGVYVRQYVRDKDRAWAVGSRSGNATTISIEHANSTVGPGWRVSDTTIDTGARLVAYLHKVYGLGRPVDRVTLKQHKDYIHTECPGPYLGGSAWAKYVTAAQTHYDNISDFRAVPKPSPVRHYTVRAGDTLIAIARKFGTTVARLARLNRISDPNKIRAGQDLRIDE